MNCKKQNKQYGILYTNMKMKIKPILTIQSHPVAPAPATVPAPSNDTTPSDDTHPPIDPTPITAPTPLITIYPLIVDKQHTDWVDSLEPDGCIIYNISAITQSDSLFNGWLFDCYVCFQKTSNMKVFDSTYELYICRQCISTKSLHELTNLYYTAACYCRQIARTKINVV